jgi:hypothetical protein
MFSWLRTEEGKIKASIGHVVRNLEHGIAHEEARVASLEKEAIVDTDAEFARVVAYARAELAGMKARLAFLKAKL